MTRRDLSSEDMSYALRLANRNYTLVQIIRALGTKPSGKREPGSIKYMRLLDTRGVDVADQYVRRTAEAALEFVRANPAIRDRGAGLVRVLEIEECARSLPWGTYGGPGLRRALEAAFAVGERVGSVKFGLSWREWSELAGQSFKAVRGHGRALHTLGWVRRNPSDRPGRTARYSLRPPGHIQTSKQSLTVDRDVNVSADRAWLSHDAFRPGALGDRGWLVLENASTPIELEHLSTGTGFDRGVLGEIVGSLEEYGLLIMRGESVERPLSVFHYSTSRLESSARPELVPPRANTIAKNGGPSEEM